jgi:hypothetical protein
MAHSEDVYDEMRRIAQTWFAENWHTSDMVYNFQNTSKPLGATRWLTFGLMFGEPNDFAICGDSIRTDRLGLVVMQLFEDRDVGTAAVYALAGKAAALFESKRLGGMLFRSATVTMTDVEGDPMLQVNVSVPFKYEDHVVKGDA